MYRMCSIVTLFLFSGICNGQRLTEKQVERDLLKPFKRIEYWSERAHYDSDSIERANEVFEKKLKEYTSGYPWTIKAKFPVLQEERLDILTSSDGLFRIYNWNTHLGGTEYDFGNVFQYKAGRNTKSFILRDTSSVGNDLYAWWYSKLYTFKVNHQTYYLAVYNGIYSTADCGQGIKVLSIKDGQLQSDIKLIKTATGLHSDIYFDYNFMTVAYLKNRPTIYFNPDNNSIYLPLVTEKGAVTKKYIIYKFTGRYFERVKN